MYILDSFLDEKFLGIKWTSEKHKRVAVACLLRNKNITRKDELVRYSKIINEIEAIDTTTFADISELGVPLF